jgi:hypothetical protein
MLGSNPVPEIIDPVFAKTSQNARFLLSEYERFGLVFTKTRVYKFGHGTVATTALAIRRSNHSARSHPQVVITFSAKNMGTQMILLAKDSQIKPLFFRINKFTFMYLKVHKREHFLSSDIEICTFS